MWMSQLTIYNRESEEGRYALHVSDGRIFDDLSEEELLEKIRKLLKEK